MKSTFIIHTNERSYPLNNIFTFSGGEVQVRLPDTEVSTPVRPKDQPVVEVEAQIRDSEGVMALMLIKDAIDWKYSSVRKYLTLHYLPYARQDRVCQEGEALSARVFIGLLNRLGFNKVQVLDVHNELLVKGIHNVDHISSEHVFARLYQEVKQDLSNYVLMAPDKGALPKVNRLISNQTYRGVERVSASKIRDVTTGQILDTQLNLGNISLRGKTVLILDDICDGGRTFIEIAKKLKSGENAPARIELLVTHGIFSKGLEVFDGLIDHIYTTNSFCQLEKSDILTIWRL